MTEPSQRTTDYEPHSHRYFRLTWNISEDSQNPIDQAFERIGSSRYWSMLPPLPRQRLSFNARKTITFNPDATRPSYQAANRCIYCSNPGPYSEEHIISEGFGGTIVLKQASCGECASQTGGTEQSILRTVLWASRRHLGIRTKKRSKKSAELPDPALLSAGQQVSFSLKEHPTLLFLPIFAPPGLLMRRALGTPGMDGMWAKNLNLNRESLTKKDISEVSYLGFDTLKFCQILAKIAHAFATAELRDGFKPLLTSFIRRRFEKEEAFLNCYDWIGGFHASQFKTPPPTDFLHEIGYGFHDVGERSFVVVRLRLFSNLAAPVYFIVVGETDYRRENQFPVKAQFANTTSIKFTL